MPYNTYKKNYRRKRSYRRRQPRSSYALAKKSYYMAKKAQGQKELKYVGFGTTSSFAVSTGIVVSLSNIAQGDTNITREGNVIYPTSLRMKWDFNATTTDHLMRIIIFKWRPNTTPTMSDVLQNNNIISYKSIDQRFNANIIYDKTFTCNLNGYNKHSINIVRKFNKYTMGFPSATTQANYNSLWCLVVGDTGSNEIPFSFTSRLYFKDA